MTSQFVFTIGPSPTTRVTPTPTTPTGMKGLRVSRPVSKEKWPARWDSKGPRAVAVGQEFRKRCEENAIRSEIGQC